MEEKNKLPPNLLPGTVLKYVGTIVPGDTIKFKEAGYLYFLPYKLTIKDDGHRENQ